MKRILLEEIGVYLQSEMSIIKEEKNNVYNELTKQQIQSITAGITETKIVEEKWNGEKYYIKASISVDPDEVNKNIARIGADQSKLKELEDVRHKADDAYAEIERLRKELAVTKYEANKQAKQKEYNVASNALSAMDWLLKGYNAYKKTDYENAILYYQKAIDLKPDFADAYNNQGLVKFALKDNQEAIADFTKGINLRSDYPESYMNRGNAKAELKDYPGALADYTKAISLNPNLAEAYYDRGTLKLAQKDYDEAIDDYAMAIGLKPDLAEVYYNRGLAKFRRGIAKSTLKDQEEAIVDYTKAIGLKPDYANAYMNRGLAYLILGQKSNARTDFMRTIELGHRVPQNILDLCK